MPRILIVDDEASIVLAVRDELVFEGFDVESAGDGPTGLQKARDWHPDVLLLDLMLPGMNGFEVCRHVRVAMPEVWIIMLTVRGQEVDRVMGLELGADDYVTKPFSLRELVARVKVGLRRRQQQHTSWQEFGDIQIDLSAHRVLKSGTEVVLTPKEFEILTLLVERAGQVVTRAEFCDRIWGPGVFVTPRVIDTHIASLRKKLRDDPRASTSIHSLRGVGYKLGGNSAQT
jgi:DNA-binding response OmpR family regulator